MLQEVCPDLFLLLFVATERGEYELRRIDELAGIGRNVGDEVVVGVNESGVELQRRLNIAADDLSKWNWTAGILHGLVVVPSAGGPDQQANRHDGQQYIHDRKATLLWRRGGCTHGASPMK